MIVKMTLGLRSRLLGRLYVRITKGPNVLALFFFAVTISSAAG